MTIYNMIDNNNGNQNTTNNTNNNNNNNTTTTTTTTTTTNNNNNDKGLTRRVPAVSGWAASCHAKRYTVIILLVRF